MGEYFSYVNHSKQLYFGTDLIAHNPKFSGIGHTIGTRAFELLLVLPEGHNPRCTQHPLIGSWIGDKVAIIGDQGKAGDFCQKYQDITANMIVLLYKVNGAEYLLEIAKKNKYFFAALGYMISTNQLPEIASDFEHEFGEYWMKRHKEDLREYAPYNLYLIQLEKYL